MKSILSFFFLIGYAAAFAQEKPTVIIGFNDLKVSEAFIVIEKKYNVRISYTDNLIVDKTISLTKKKRFLKELLEEFFEKLELQFEFINARYIVVTKRDDFIFKNNTNQLEEIVITGYLAKGIVKNKDASYIIKPKELEILPGLVEADILESIQELPGVISPNETATGLNIRGGTEDQNQIIWDGINIYHNGHLFGMVSTFNPNITQNVVFYNKGVHSKFGERVSSVIAIETTKKVAKKTTLDFGLNAINADFNIDLPLIKNKLSMMFAFRKSYEGIYETSAFDNMEKKVFQSTRVHVDGSEEKFYFKDYNLKLNYKPNINNLFSFSFIHIDNDLEDLHSKDDNTISFQDILDSENDGYSFSWEKKWKKNITQNTLFSHSNYRLFYDFNTFSSGSQIKSFNKKNDVKDTNFSTELNLKTKKENLFTIGYQTSIKDISYSFSETDFDVFFELDKNSTKVTTHSLYSHYTNRSSSFFDFDTGVRINYYSQFNKFRIEPRFVIIKNLNNNLKIQLTGEIRNQIVSQIEETVLSDLSLENKLWRLADDETSPIIFAKQVSLGVIYHQNGWSLDLDTYYKKTSDITALSLGFLSNNNGGTPFNEGKKLVFGTDFYIKKDFKRIKTWISYSFLDIKNQFNNINNNEYFTANNEIKHAISSSIAYKTKKIQIALGWKWHSGKPYTVSSLDPINNTFIFEGVNTGTLPNYNRLDLSSIYNFTLSRTHQLKGKFGISIRNLLNNDNLISREYTGNNTPNDPIIMVDKYSLERTVNFVFRIFL